MKIDKEKILLGVVLAVVAGRAWTDRVYRSVPVPATASPAAPPPMPSAAAPPPRAERPRGRSMLEIFSDLKPADLVVLKDIPREPVPLATPPVRPGPHPDASRRQRHLFFDPAEAEAASTVDAGGTGTTAPAGGGSDAAGTGAAGGEEETKPIEEKVEKAPPPDLAQFDWVKPHAGGASLGRTQYGRIEILGKDRDAGRTKFDLLVDPAMEFNFQIIDEHSGKAMGGFVPWRERTEELGFADTVENNCGSKRRRMEAASGRSSLSLEALRELAAWELEEAGKPKYTKDRRKAMDSAAAAYREVTLRNPDDKDTVKALGRVYRLLQDLDEESALYGWWLASQKKSRDPEILALLGETCELAGLPERARLCYEESLVTAPDAKVRLRLAEIYLSSGSLEDARKAVAAFARAAQDGEPTAGVVGEASAHIALGDYEKAKQALQRVTADAEKTAGWYDAMGAVLYAADPPDLAKARDHFQAAVEHAPPASFLVGVSRTNLAFAKARLGALLAEDDKGRALALEDAVKTAEDALKDDPLNYYWPLVARAYALRALGKREKAVESLQEAVAALPGEAYGHTLLGEFYLRDGRTADARTRFQEACRLAPAFPDALGGVGRVGGGAPGEAKEYLRRASSLEPSVALWPLQGARAVLSDEAVPEKQRYEDAKKDLNYTLGVDRNSWLALTRLGWVRYYQGDPDEALDRWNSAQRVLNGVRASSAREAALIEEMKEWITEARAKVDKWMFTRIWRDEFKRQNGPSAGNGWAEEERTVKWSLEDGAAVLGPGRIGKDETPALWREQDALKVLKALVAVQVGRDENEQVDILFWMPQGKTPGGLFQIGLRKTVDGKMLLLWRPSQKTKESEMVQDLGDLAWPEDGRVEFGFVKMDEARGVIQLLLNGQPVKGYEAQEIQNLGKGKSGRLRVEVRVTASSGTEVRARVEKVELWLDTH